VSRLAAQLLGWMERQLRPRAGWAVWGLTLALVVWPGWALAATGWVRRSGPALIAVGVITAALGWVTAGRVRRGWALAFVAWALVYPVTALTAGHAWPPWGLLARAVGSTLAWALSAGRAASPQAAWTTWLTVLAHRVAQFNYELWAWFQGALTGQVQSGRFWFS